MDGPCGYQDARDLCQRDREGGEGNAPSGKSGRDPLIPGRCSGSRRSRRLARYEALLKSLSPASDESVRLESLLELLEEFVSV